MLNLIIRSALTNRLLVLAVTGLLLVFGYSNLKEISFDVFPDLTKPVVSILTEDYGRAPEEMETLITIPLENALRGLPGLERVRSVSGIGLSVIYLEFSWDTDLFKGRQIVAEKLQLVKDSLPNNINPVMGPITGLMGQIQQIAISSKELDPIELRTLADWNIRPRLMSIPGIAQITTVGGGVKQYQILISAEKLSRYQISMDQLEHDLSKISQNTTGGFLDHESQEILIRNIGSVESIEDIKTTVVGIHLGRPVLIQDIAEVKIGHQQKRGDGSYMGRPAVIMAIQKQLGADTLTVTKSIEEAISLLKKNLPEGIVIDTDVFKQSHFIERSIEGITSKLQYGTILVFIVLLIFLANMRMSLITLMAIPISFIITSIIFKFFGLSINTMTLGGLAIAIGELVDDSIVDVENIFRRLKENTKLEKPLSRLKVVYNASSEIRNSIVLATIIIALVFIPLFNLTGIEGRLFSPLAISYLTALLSSLLVSLTLTPVLSYYLLNNLQKHDETRFLKFLKNIDKKVLEKALDRPKAVIVSTFILLCLSMGLIPFMGQDFLPQFNEGNAMAGVYAPTGASLQESNRLGKIAEEKIMSIPEVKMVSRRTGRAEQDEHAMPVNVSEIDIDFHPNTKRDREQILNNIREELSSIEGISFNVGQPLSHLIDHTLSGVSAQLAIKVFGTDLTTLRKLAMDIHSKISDVNGLVDLRVEQQALVPELKIYVLREEAARYGISAGEISSLAESAFNGQNIAKIIEDQKYFNLFYRFDDQSRQSEEKMGQTVIKVMPNGQKIKLEDVADIYQTQGINEISRENGTRRIVISANISGRDQKSLVEEIQNIISKEVSLPNNYYILYEGQFKAQQDAFKNILIFGVLALLGVMFVLYSHFKSKMITAQIMITIPFAFIGALSLLFLTERTLTVASMVGLITLCGITCRNSIMMISHYLHLMKYEGEHFSKAMIIRGSLERLTPVLMTATVTALALLPLTFSKGQPGSEIIYPVAIVIVGGLVTSTLLDIIVTPVIFYIFGKEVSEKQLKQIEEQL